MMHDVLYVWKLEREGLFQSVVITYPMGFLQDINNIVVRTEKYPSSIDSNCLNINLNWTVSENILALFEQFYCMTQRRRRLILIVLLTYFSLGWCWQLN